MYKNEEQTELRSSTVAETDNNSDQIDLASSTIAVSGNGMNSNDEPRKIVNSVPP